MSSLGETGGTSAVSFYCFNHEFVSPFPVITCVNHSAPCNTSSKWKKWYLQCLSLHVPDATFVNNSVLPIKLEKISVSKPKMLVLLSWNNTLWGFGVFFTLLRKSQQSHFRMKFCFNIQTENTYTVLKTFPVFFFWEAKVFMKLICNSQCSAQIVISWVTHLLIQYNSVCSTMTPTRSSLYAFTVAKHIFHLPHLHI